MRFLQGLIMLCWGVLGCASGPSTTGEPANYGIKDGRVWVRGPWSAITPSSDADEVIDQLCPAIMELPGAQFGDYGQEYCGLIYSLGDGTYYASHPSPLGDTRPGRVSREKNCYVPLRVVDTRGHPETLADYHGHPWSPSSMLESRTDLLGATQLFSIRIQFDKACHLQKLIPYMKEERPGELYERRGKSWKLIGHIKPEHKALGRVTLVTDGTAPMRPAASAIVAPEELHEASTAIGALRPTPRLCALQAPAASRPCHAAGGRGCHVPNGASRH